MMLWKLLSRIDRKRFEPFVIALSGESDRILQSFADIGVPCELLGMRPGRPSLRPVLRLRRMLRDLAPDVVQGWMYHGNIAATAASLFRRPRVPVLWNIRGSLDPTLQNRATAFITWAGGKLSFTTARIINNSLVSAVQHEERFGYSASKRIILPNGFDTDVFRPSEDARRALRESLGLPAHALLVGLIAHYRPVKDHANFVRAAGIVRRLHPNAYYVLAGERLDASNSELAALIAEHGLRDRVFLLGDREDVAAIAAALDIAASSSAGEGFPNVIGEAMSCGVPCVVTDVGDSAYVVADTGVSVPPQDSEALAQGIAKLIDAGDVERRALGLRARQRIVDHFSLDSVVRQYESLYVQVHREYSANRGV